MYVCFYTINPICSWFTTPQMVNPTKSYEVWLFCISQNWWKDTWIPWNQIISKPIHKPTVGSDFPYGKANVFYGYSPWISELEANISRIYRNKCTSSTARGGGGSFKNRKPIGEIGCCESWMAERIHWWTERWLELCFLEWLQWLQWSPHHNFWMWCGVVQL